MSDHIGARQCFFCGVCTVRGWPRRSRRRRRSIESYLLTPQYLDSHQCVRVYANHLFEERQITEQDRICRTCLLRATRFVARQRQMDEQREFEIAAAQVANAEVFQPSSRSSSTPNELLGDPLGEAAVSENSSIEEHVPEPLNVIEQPPLQPPELLSVAALPVPGFTRISSTSLLCIVYGCNSAELHRIPPFIRRDILKTQSIFIHNGARVCEEHLQSIVWGDILLHCRPTHDNNMFNSAQLAAMCKLFQMKDKPFIDFENLDSIEDRIFYFYVGYNKAQFADILTQSPAISQRFQRKPKTALATVLCKLRTGDSNERLSSLFRMTPQHFGSLVRKTQKCLMSDFVPNHLGFDHLYGPGRAFQYREELQQRTLRIPHVLFMDRDNDQLINICDGTYFYVQKSSNYEFQRKTYSSHKYRNLTKVFLIVSTDGYIIEAFGPYEANKSDASIMEELISENENNHFHWFYKQGDIFILDRGFRDIKEKMESTGYTVYMPLTKDENERQLSTQQANDSRKVTLCRWVVETINGRLKNQFRQLRSQCSNYTVPRLAEEVKIACALINAFGKKLTDSELVDEIINEIYLKQDTANLLSELVIANNFNQRRATFQRIDASEGFHQFPALDYNELILIALGPYQVAQARSYYGEHIKPNGAFIIEVYEDRNIDYDLNRFSIVTTEPWLLRAKIQSRHHSHRIYFVYILVDNGLQGRNKIVGYYCNCLVGKRTLGCCAHVMCIIWYMAWARHQDDPVQPPAAFLDIIWADFEDEDNVV